MKRIFLNMKNCIALVFFLFFVYSEEFVLDTIQAQTYNDILGRQIQENISVRYSTKNKIIILLLKDIFGWTAIWISSEKKNNFMSVLDKYLEWNIKAKKKKVKINKNISLINLKITWQYTDNEWHTSTSQPKIEFSFLSQNIDWHQMYIIFPKLQSTKNQFVSKKIDTLYFNEAQVKRLKKVMSDRFIQKMIKKNKKQKELESDFK